MISKEERQVIRAMRLLHEMSNASLKEVDVDPIKGVPTTTSLISPELKIRHKKTKLLYTVSSTSEGKITLRNPEGEPFTISIDEFEKEYDLD